MKGMIKITWKHRIISLLCALLIGVILLINKAPTWVEILFTILDYEINIIQARLGMFDKDEEGEA
jgi:hypothetical protein